jgi:hypothetical protein
MHQHQIERYTNHLDSTVPRPGDCLPLSDALHKACSLLVTHQRLIRVQSTGSEIQSGLECNHALWISRTATSHFETSL